MFYECYSVIRIHLLHFRTELTISSLGKGQIFCSQQLNFPKGPCFVSNILMGQFSLRDNLIAFYSLLQIIMDVKLFIMNILTLQHNYTSES